MTFGELTSGMSSDCECEGRWPLSVVPRDGTEVWGSTYEQGESRGGEGK
jgi:hypothetical protein